MICIYFLEFERFLCIIYVYLKNKYVSILLINLVTVIVYRNKDPSTAVANTTSVPPKAVNRISMIAGVTSDFICQELQL